MDINGGHSKQLDDCTKFDQKSENIYLLNDFKV